MSSFSMKTYQLLMTGARGTFYPFISIWLLSCGMPPTVVGFISSIKSFCITFFGPTIVAYADNTKQHMRVTFVCTLVSSLMAALAYFMTLIFPPDGSLGYNLTMSALLSVMFAFRAPITPLMDGAIMMRLRDEGRPEDYGKIRLYGTIGFGIAGSLAGFVMERFGYSSITVLFVVQQLCSILFLGSLFPSMSNASEKGEKTGKDEDNVGGKKKKSSYKDMYESFKKLYREEQGFGLFLLIVLFMGSCKSVIGTHYTVLLELNDLPKSVIGISVGLSTVSEIPLFYFSNVLIRRYGSRSVMLFAQVGMIVRHALMTVLSGKYLLLPQLLHGVTYALLWSSIVNYVNVIAPPAYATTTLSLVSVCFNGISSFVSEILSGFVHQYMGCVALFRICTVMATISTLIWAAFLSWTKKEDPKKKKKAE